MKRILFTTVTLLSLLLTEVAYAQIGGNAVYNSNNYFNNNYNGATLGEVDLSLNNYSYSFSNLLEANVMINAKATSYVAIFSLTQFGKTIEETEQALKSRVDIFTTKLEQQGVNRQQIFIDPVSLVPTYEVEVTEKKYSKTFNEIPKGYEIKKNVHITFNHHEQINQIIAIATQAEVYDLVKVDYSVENMDIILDQLRQEALKILVIKKETFEKAGMHIRLNKLGEKYGSVYPIERYAQYYAYKTSSAPVYSVSYKKGLPQQQIQYNPAEKNKTIYYEKVSDKQFDKIINPVVGEPVVQIYLSLKAEYYTYDPEKEAADKLYNEQQRNYNLKEMELRLEERQKAIDEKRKKK